MKNFLRSAVIAVTLSLSVVSPTGAADVTAIVGVNVAPMDEERVLANHTVIVEGDRITAMGPRDETPTPDGADIIDGDGRYLIPGLAEMHGHLPSGGANAEDTLFLYVAGATIPILTLAAVFVAFDVVDALRSPVVIGWVSIIFGLLLWHADRAPSSKEGLGRIGFKEAMIIGSSQMLALIPGVSRSGITMTTARYLGWTRTEAARFSMLLAIPTILALGFFAGIALLRDGAEASIASAAIVAVLSFLSALAAIAFLMHLTQRMSFTPFVVYRIAFGVLLLASAGSLAKG